MVGNLVHIISSMEARQYKEYMVIVPYDKENYRIAEVWDDEGDAYIKVEVGDGYYVDVEYPNNSIEQVVSRLQQGESPYSFPLYTIDGDYVYTDYEEGYSTGDIAISEDDAWEVVEFVTEELHRHGADYL